MSPAGENGLIAWAPLLPFWALFLVGLGLLALLGHGCLVLRRKNLPLRWVAVLSVLRLAAVAVFLLCLLQPVLTVNRRARYRPVFLVMVDNSASMGARDGPGEISRLGEAFGWLRESELLRRLENGYELAWFSFHRRARSLADGPAARLETAAEPARYPESIGGARQYLDHLAGGAARAGSAVEGLLLVSDGSDGRVTETVRIARRAGLPVYTLAPETAAAAAPPERFRILQAAARPRVLLGSDMRLAVVVGRENAGPGQRRVTVIVEEEGEPLRERDVVFRAGQGEESVTLTLRPERPGMREYVVRLAAADNDEPVKVADEEVGVPVLVERHLGEILFVENTWRWDFRYLRRVFEDDPDFSFTAFLERSRGIYVQFADPGRRFNLTSFPATRSELELFDTFVLGDINPAGLPGAVPALIRDLVLEEGRNLVVVAGPNLARLARVPELAELLPVVLGTGAGRPQPGPVPVRIAGEALDSPYFHAASGADLWDNLPPFDQVYPPVRKRAGATVLVDTPGLRNEYGNLIVIAHHHVGRGQVLFIGTDTMWHWQTMGAEDEHGNTPFTVFWKQALRTLAARRAAAGDTTLEMQPERRGHQAGQRVFVRAVFRSPRHAAPRRLEGEVRAPGDRRLPLHFQPVAGEEGVFRAEFLAADPGVYRLSAVAGDGGASPVEAQVAIGVIPAPAPGHFSLPVNHAVLADIARGSGGAVIDRRARDSWPGPPSRETLAVTRRVTLNLWQNLFLPVLLVFLLGVDWFIRLLRGYV